MNLASWARKEIVNFLFSLRFFLCLFSFESDLSSKYLWRQMGHFHIKWLFLNLLFWKGRWFDDHFATYLNGLINNNPDWFRTATHNSMKRLKQFEFGFDSVNTCFFFLSSFVSGAKFLFSFCAFSNQKFKENEEVKKKLFVVCLTNKVSCKWRSIRYA